MSNFMPVFGLEMKKETCLKIKVQKIYFQPGYT